ncbi:glycerophosphodiester phosphodiesterase [Flaviaesturariibacter amylovorans]|uniref:GP-PDE domain-containing protein n=1 Tax=Flaviaesturariibacter amylovorans TaxID=1084520 RepID=A0ABP8GG36_9BACT
MPYSLTRTTFLALGLLLLGACRRDFDVRLPDNRWEAFEAPGTAPLGASVAARMEGVYTVAAGSDRFGADAVGKWSHTAAGADTVFHFSLFFGKDISYLVLEGRRRDSTLLLHGYWRSMTGIETGAVRLTVTPEAGGRALLLGTAIGAGGLVLEGAYGDGNGTPDRPLRFSFDRPLAASRPLEIVAHRGGGTSADLLPASENSLEILPYAARFGATGVEIDVRLTRDGVPVLYHDATLNERLIVKNGLVGPIENYTFAQLDGLVRLVRGNERIPTLRAALETILTRTPLRFVWLDTKFDAPIDGLRALQAEFQQRAAVLGRPLEIVIGIPDEQVLERFRALPGHRDVPSLVELETADAESVNARIWAPRWTLGLQNDKVAAMQAQGRRAFVWTLDLPENVALFLREGRFDGILSNYPTAVAYAHYIRP